MPFRSSENAIVILRCYFSIQRFWRNTLRIY